MGKCGIACIGVAVVDTIKVIDHYPVETHYVEVLQSWQNFGGSVPNVLIDIAMIDKSIPFFAVSEVGDDKEGDLIISALKDFGIETTDIRKNSRQETSKADIMCTQNSGSRTIFYHIGASNLIGLEFLENIRLTAKIVQLGYLGTLPNLDIQTTDEFGSNFARALSHFREQGCQTTFDTASVEVDSKMHKIFFSCLPHTDYLIMNDVEAGNFFSVDIRDSNNTLIDDVLKSITNKAIQLGVKNSVIIHCPEKAVYYDIYGSFYDMPSFPIKIKDIKNSVGAGDAFTAGFLYGVYKEYNPEIALKIGHASAWFNLQNSASSYSKRKQELLKKISLNDRSNCE